MKKCKKCGEEKEVSEFHKNSARNNGCQAYCKLCTKAYSKINGARREITHEANKWLYETTKVCSKCKIKKELNEFYIHKNNTDGRLNKCSECIKEERKIYNKNNKKKIFKAKKSYRESNKEKIKARKKAYQEAKRNEHIEELKQIISPNDDDKWIYVLKCGLYNKIGISNDPLRRIPELERETGFEVKLLYLAKANYGRTVDTENIIHHDLKEFNIPIPYKTKQVSREWFYGDLELFIEVISKYCEVEAISIKASKVS